MASLGNEFAMLVLVTGNWHSLAKLESELTRLGEATGLSLHMKRTEPRAPRTELLPYSIDVVCLDQSGHRARACRASAPAAASTSPRSPRAPIPRRTPARRCSPCR